MSPMIAYELHLWPDEVSWKVKKTVEKVEMWKTKEKSGKSGNLHLDKVRLEWGNGRKSNI